ncbi:MAG: hypothetical protein ACR2LI_09950 [Propionibacteriaceae bacterium]
MSLIQPPVQLAAVVLAGLVAGLLLAFAVAVLPGLAKVDDQTFVATMRSINVAILNPVFLLLWLGAPLLAIGTAGLSLRSKEAIPWAIAGALLMIATFVITAAVNIPLNDALA